jgi:hypothetical protein
VVVDDSLDVVYCVFGDKGLWCFCCRCCCVLSPFTVTNGACRCRCWRGSARGRSLSNDLGALFGASRSLFRLLMLLLMLLLLFWESIPFLVVQVLLSVSLLLWFIFTKESSTAVLIKRIFCG